MVVGSSPTVGVALRVSHGVVVQWYTQAMQRTGSTAPIHFIKQIIVGPSRTVGDKVPIHITAKMYRGSAASWCNG